MAPPVPPVPSESLRWFSFHRRNHGRAGSFMALLGVIGILGFTFQWEDILPRSVTWKGCSIGTVHFSSFVDCADTSNAIGVRTQENHWGAFDPVVSSVNCTTILASNKSSDPRDWLQMCEENHDIYRRYIAQAPSNYLTDLIPAAEENRTQEVTTGNKLSLLFIGDSLDKFLVYHVCNITRGIATKVDPPKYWYRRPFVCSSPTVEIGFLNIFGMYRTCENTGVAHRQDKRSFNTTADRVAALLPDVLEHMQTKPGYVQLSSALWDLSQGCVGRDGVPDNYQREYSLGMRRIYDLLTLDEAGLASNASIYWRTSPPMRKSYSRKWARISLIPFNVGAHGRTRRNQRVINQLMKRTFSKYKLGSGIVDWWDIVEGVSERFLTQELPDGRHYTFCSSMAFFNEWLEQIQHETN